MRTVLNGACFVIVVAGILIAGFSAYELHGASARLAAATDMWAKAAEQAAIDKAVLPMTIAAIVGGLALVTLLVQALWKLHLWCLYQVGRAVAAGVQDALSNRQ